MSDLMLALAWAALVAHAIALVALYRVQRTQARQLLAIAERLGAHHVDP